MLNDVYLFNLSHYLSSFFKMKPTKFHLFSGKSSVVECFVRQLLWQKIRSAIICQPAMEAGLQI
jgi:hypothetical protein